MLRNFMNKKVSALVVFACLLAVSSVVIGQTEEDVGDLASFGKEVRFFGFAATGLVVISRDCTTIGFPLGPDDRCFTISPTQNSVSFDAKDIGRIFFPQKTFQTIIYTPTRHQFA